MKPSLDETLTATEALPIAVEELLIALAEVERTSLAIVAETAQPEVLSTAASLRGWVSRAVVAGRKIGFLSTKRPRSGAGALRLVRVLGEDIDTGGA